MELLINRNSCEIHNADDLKARLSELAHLPFAEVWLTPAADWPVICVLSNGQSAWLMFLRYEGDAGFSTRNSNYAGPEKAVIEYRLANGQRDEYPASWDVSTPEAIRALEFFFSKQAMAPWLIWHEEGR